MKNAAKHPFGKLILGLLSLLFVFCTFATADVVNVKDYGAVGDGVTDDTTAINNAVNAWMNKTAFRGTLLFPLGTYRMTSPLIIPAGQTIFGDIRGENSVIDFDFSNGAVPKHCVEIIGVRELEFHDIWFRQLNPNSVPQTGIFLARQYSSSSTSGIWCGRIKMYNTRCTGYFTVAAYYNYASEEMLFLRPQFRNDYLDAKGMVITASNIDGLTSDNVQIVTGAQSCTLYNILSPHIVAAGYNSPCTWDITGVSGLNVTSAYLQGNGDCIVRIYAIDSAINNIIFEAGWQTEQWNKDTSIPGWKNFNNAFLIKSSTSASGKQINHVRIMPGVNFGSGSIKIEDTRDVVGCDLWGNLDIVSVSAFSAEYRYSLYDSKIHSQDGVIDLDGFKSLKNVEIYTNSWANISGIKKRSTVKIFASDAPPFEDTTADTRTIVSGVLAVSYKSIKVQGEGGVADDLTTITFSGGTPLHGQQIIICNSSSSGSARITIKHNVGNIYVRGGMDYQIAVGEMVELQYNEIVGKWFAMP